LAFDFSGGVLPGTLGLHQAISTRRDNCLKTGSIQLADGILAVFEFIGGHFTAKSFFRDRELWRPGSSNLDLAALQKENTSLLAK